MAFIFLTLVRFSTSTFRFLILGYVNRGYASVIELRTLSFMIWVLVLAEVIFVCAGAGG